MSATFLPPVLPWSGPQPEDLQFRRILGSVMTLFLVAGATVPYLRVPQVESDLEPDIPARLAQVIAEPIALTRTPATISRPRQATARPLTPSQKAAVKKPEKMPEETPSTPARGDAPPRKQVAQTGLLALSDALNTLRRATPHIATDRPVLGRGERVGQAPAEKTKALTVGVTQGSGGIGVGAPTHQQVLGATGLPISGIATGRRYGDPADRAGMQAAREAPGVRRGNVRTEEEIQEVLDRNKRAIYRIYNRELLVNPRLHGKVVASITIAPSGKVTNCQIVYSDLGASSFEEELISLIRRIDFGPKPGVPLVTTRVPIEFFPT